MRGLNILSHPLTIDLQTARSLTALDLVSAREAIASDGRSYHEMEQTSESPSHRSAREKAIAFLLSRGYRVFAEGIGVKGTYTLADFIAIRPDEQRVVFVEVLSDTGLQAETVARKRALQQFGELCFVVFKGKESLRSEAAEELKSSLTAFADVLTVTLNAYVGNFVRESQFATVGYQTTREEGVTFLLQRNTTAKKDVLDFTLATRRYANIVNAPIADIEPNEAYFIECLFLELFEELCRKFSVRVQHTRSNRSTTAHRAMRRKSGLKAGPIDKFGRPVNALFGTLKSDYRGPPVENQYIWTHHPSSYDVSPEELHAVFSLERNFEGSGDRLLGLIRERGVKVSPV